MTTPLTSAPPEDLTPQGLVRELGTSGLKIWSGQVAEDWLKEWSGDRKARTIREMVDNDPIVGALLFAIEMLIRRVQWRVQASADTPSASAAADFVDSCVEDMSHTWDALISEIVSFLAHGYSYHEVVYKRRLGNKGEAKSKYSDGKIGWRKIPIRAQTTIWKWEVDAQGGIQGAYQQDPSAPAASNIYIPIGKALLFRTSSSRGNPEGRSVLRNAFRPWFFKKRIEEIEGIGVERDLAGLPVIYAPAKIMAASASADDQALFSELKRIVTNIRRDEQEGIVLPGDTNEAGKRLYELSLLSSGGSRQFNTSEIITRYEQRMAMTILADFIMLGHDSVGSHALSISKTSMFISAIEAWLSEIKGVFNRHAIPKLMELNGFAEADTPTLEYGDIVAPDLKALGEYVKALSGAGVALFPDDDLENYLRTAGRLPERVAGLEEVVDTARDGINQPTAEQARSAEPVAGGGV